MGLFSALASSASEGDKPSASTLSIPTVVQLYSNKPILLEKNAKSRKFDILSYQTVTVSSSATEEEPEGGALLSKQQKEAANLHPNLGVWNCRVTKGKVASDQQPLIDQILRVVPSSNTRPPTVCMTVDFSNLSEVEPTISLLQDALVRYLIARGQDKTSVEPSPTAKTSLYDLRSTNFGLAENDEESAKSMSASPPQDSDKNIRLALAICVMLPAGEQETENAATPEGSSGGGYKEKQAEALVLYHLRKYAARLNAVLCFVQKDKPSEEASKAVSALTLRQLSFVWRQVANGEEGWKELDSTKEDEEGAEQTNVAGIYGPGNHHEELIEAVLLRNAQFPGHWDASKDSIWVALPASQTENEKKEESEESTDKAGDNSWLSELRSSVVADVKTPPPKGKSEAADASKTPNDAAVSSFFESLLKP